LDASPFNVQVHGDDYDIIQSYDSNLVIMGNVAYPFSTETFKNHPQYNDAMNNLVEHSTKIVLYANIGDVIPSASRESLDLREKTVKWIGASLVRISKDIAKNIMRNLDSQKTIWDARVYLSTLNSKHQRMVNNYVKDGVLISSYTTDTMEIGIKKVQPDYKFTSVSQISCRRDTVIYASKGDITSGSIRKRVKHDEKPEYNRYVVEFKNATEYNAFVNHPQIIGAKIIDLATIELPKIERQKSANAHDAYLFLGDRYTHSPKDAWEKTRVNFKLGKGVYVKISNYNVEGFTPNLMFKLLQALEEFGHGITLYGIRDSDTSRLGDGWEYLRVYVQNVIDNLPQSFKDSASRGYIHDYIDIDTRSLYDSFADLENDPFNFKQIVDFSNYNYDDTKAIQTISMFINSGFKFDLTKEKQIVNELKELKSKYPLIKYTQIHSGSIPFIKEYIEAMNK
jgi:hypothetical protein